MYDKEHKAISKDSRVYNKTREQLDGIASKSVDCSKCTAEPKETLIKHSPKSLVITFSKEQMLFGDQGTTLIVFLNEKQKIGFGDNNLKLYEVEEVGVKTLISY
ncbi:hypothetical protein [Paenibacillus sp. 481]|uniref:hypothetical protein n=1 Tax=Paenibacillus sp. 481 TaxID=2835869 RepID=UPI001E496937|nr:hypothetical protein [Paenibacillus sp. 481]UHA73067.1 hypothetical protein KIK04_21115 [Paenibacillus sp. 481]